MKKRQRRTSPVDAEKEALFKGLSEVFTSSGIKVRREELKRGIGWKVLSGSCRLNEDKLIIIDKRSSIDEQLSFLVNQLESRGMVPNMNSLSPELKAFFSKRLST